MSVDFDDEATVSFIEASRIATEAKPPTLFIFHRDGAQIVTLNPGKKIIIGRAEDADISIRDTTLSRHHARIEYIENEIWIEDLKSTNGTTVNGMRIVKMNVQPGDDIECGSVTVTVSVSGGEFGTSVESHDHFMDQVENERARARMFGRRFALVMVRPAAHQGKHVSHWCGGVQKSLREVVDRTAFYAGDILEILLPEAGYDEAFRISNKIVEAGQDVHIKLLCGVALYPDDGTSTDEMLQKSHQALQLASPDEPVHFSANFNTSLSQANIRLSQISDDELIVSSPAMRAVCETAAILSRSVIPVLIFGETGSGKEVIARLIHTSGDRKDKPLRTINCGAIPENLIESVLFGHERGAFTGAQRQTKGIFESANGGTVLLDEIGELSHSAQAALLRVLETKQVTRIGSTHEFSVDVRILAATHRNLEGMCNKQMFRWDLFYRLNTMTLKIPPLRERIEDIEPLAKFFAYKASKQYGLSEPRMHPSVISCLENYPWPGNIRELRNVIERAVVLAQGHTITLEDLSEQQRRQYQEWDSGETEFDSVEKTDVLDVAPKAQKEMRGDVTRTLGKQPPRAQEDALAATFRDRVQRYEAELLLHALKRFHWNRTAVAQNLNIPLRTLTYKIQMYRLEDSHKSLTQEPMHPNDVKVIREIKNARLLDFKTQVRGFEAALIRDTLKRCNENKSEAARILKIPLRTLMHKIKNYGIETAPEI